MLTKWRQNKDLWNPSIDTDQSIMFNALQRFHDRMEQLFQEFEMGFGQNEGFGLSSIPKCSIYDNGSAFIVKADVPGLTKDEIDISVQDNVLTIRGEHNESIPDDYSVHRREHTSTKFLRRLTLPSDADAERTSADLKDGVLTIKLEKKNQEQAKQITIK